MSLTIASRLFSRFTVEADLICCVFCAPVFIFLADRDFPERITVSRHEDTARNVFYKLSIADFHPALSDFHQWSAFQADVSHPSVSNVPRLQSTSYDAALWQSLDAANAVIAFFLPCRNARQRYGGNHPQRGYFTCDAASHGTRAFGPSRALGEEPSRLEWETCGSTARALEKLRTEDLHAAADREFKLSIPTGCGTIDSWLSGIGDDIVTSPV